MDAAEFHGRVVGVPDGDSLVVLDDRRRPHRVRLAGVDAPEKGQRFSNRSRAHLSALVRRQSVVVIWHKRDSYDRLVGVVYREDRDVNLEQIRAGYAWWYRAYAAEQSYDSRRSYESAELEARQQRRGLWIDNRPVPPWKWRKRSAQGHARMHRRSRWYGCVASRNRNMQALR